MAVKEWKEEKKINTSMIGYGDYQRPLDQAWVNKITSEFMEMKANMPKVSFRDGKYWCIDGQHTIAAWIKHNGGNPLDITCEVFHGLTREKEAGLFRSFNTDRKKTATRINIKAGYIEGNPDIVEMVEAVRGAGVSVSFSGSGGDQNTVAAIGKVLDCYNKHGAKGVEWIFRLIKETWEGNKDSFRGEIIGGISEIYRIYRNDDRFDRNAFIRKLKTVPPATIVREGKELTIGGDRRYAKRLVHYYNVRLKASNRLDVAKLEA